MKTEQKKLELTSLYYQILEDPANLKGTGLFSGERLTEMASYVNESAFEPLELKNGKIVPEWWSNKFTGHIFNKFSMESGKSHRNTQVLNVLLTPEEIDKFNKYANQAWSEVNEKRRFEKAEKLDKASYSGWVYCEGAGYNEGYFESVAHFEDWQANEQEEEENEFKTEYLWACSKSPCLNIDADRIIEHATEEAYENFDANDLHGIKEFKEAVEKFNELNKDFVSYYPDYSKVILLK